MPKRANTKTKGDYTMKIRFNATGAQRKALVKAIAEITGLDSRYLGAPTFAYALDCFIIDREGTLICDDRTDEEKLGKLVAALAERGFEASVVALPNHEDAAEKAEQQTEAKEEQPTAASEENDSEANMEDDESFGLTIAMNGAGFDETAWQNLKDLVNSKAGLIKKALGIDTLPMKFTPEKISFPWFEQMPEAEDAQAYMEFISKLCKAAKTQKRVSAKERPVPNEKYAFRCFLLRLGFIGAEYKEARKILLRNLSGNGSFRDGKKKEAGGNEVSE